MKLPYGYVLIGKEIVIHEEKADVVRSIFDDYLAGASLGKIVDLLFKKGVVSPTGKVKWTRAAVDKLLANKKYIPLVGIKIYMDTQFEKARRCYTSTKTVGMTGLNMRRCFIFPILMKKGIQWSWGALRSVR